MIIACMRERVFQRKKKGETKQQALQQCILCCGLQSFRPRSHFLRKFFGLRLGEVHKGRVDIGAKGLKKEIDA